MTLDKRKLQKVSVVSIESLKIKSAKLAKHWENVDLEDKFYYVHILFLLLGLMHFLPYTFFVTANAYWMQKFRNVSSHDDLYDASKRTALQSHFASGLTMVQSISNSVFVLISALFGHRISARRRTLGALFVMTSCFCLTTLFVEVDTDSWQTVFFYVTFTILAAINSANAVLQVAVLVLLAKFPPYYMKVYLLGQGWAAVFNSVLQVLTLAIGTSTTVSALIYFVLGSSIMGLTLVTFFLSKYNKLYTYFVEHNKEDISRDMLSYSEFKGVLYIIWPSVLMFMFYEMARQQQTPVASLVVSENYGSGSQWSDVYFVPVITFLFGDICTLFGRIVCSITKPFNPFCNLVLAFLRVIVYVPLTFLCNAQPRKHLPVLLNHDWEYILVQGSLSFTNGYMYNNMFLSINIFLEPEKVEDGYLVLMICLTAIGALLSPLSAFSVDLL